MIHELKITPNNYKVIRDGSKTFELVKYNRDFSVRDILVFQEYEDSSGYTGRKIIKEISYVSNKGEDGLSEDFCILGLKNTLCVELKNIDSDEITLMNQLRKVEKENNEFETAVVKNHVNRAVEEFWDKVQSSLGALEKIGIKADIVIQDYPKHLEKIRSELPHKV